MRPEARALAGLYCAYLWWDPVHRRARYAAAIVGPPLIWMALDWAISGDPLASLHRTHTLRAALSRETGVVAATTGLPALIKEPLGPVLALTGVLGMVTAAAGHRRALRALAVAAVLVLSFLAQSAAGFSVIANCLAPVHVLLLVFAAAAVLAPWGERPVARPVLAAAVAAVTAAAILTHLPARLDEHESVRTDLRSLASSWSEMKRIVSHADARASCGPVDLHGPYAPRPLLALHLDRSAHVLRDSTTQPSLRGLHIVATDPAVARALADYAFVGRAPGPPAGARLVRRNGWWSLWEHCGAERPPVGAT